MGIRVVYNVIISAVLLAIVIFAGVQTLDKTQLNASMQAYNNVAPFFAAGEATTQPNGLLLSNAILFDVENKRFLFADKTPVSTLEVKDAYLVTRDIHISPSGKVTEMPCNRIVITFKMKKMHLGKVTEITLSKNIK